MSDTILGVILGGTISIVTTFASGFFENKKWNKKEKIEYFKEKRNKLESKYFEATAKLYEAVEKNLYPYDLLADFEYSFPGNVISAFKKMMSDQEKKDNISKYKLYLYNINCEMKKSLSEIENQITSELK